MVPKLSFVVAPHCYKLLFNLSDFYGNGDDLQGEGKRWHR